MRFLHSAVEQIMDAKVQEFKKLRGIAEGESWFDLVEQCQPEHNRYLYTENTGEEVKSQHLIPRFKIVDFGSTRLGVESVNSDIDILITTFDCLFERLPFFLKLEARLKSEKGVENFVILKNAHVPLVEFTYNGISIDIVFADMATPYHLLREINESSF